MEEILKKLINKDYKITLYNNALGTITAEAESVPSEIVLPAEKDESLLEETEWDKTQKEKAVNLVGVVITDGRTIEEALRRLEQKALH